MVKIHRDNPSQSGRDVVKSILDTACDLLDIPDNKRTEAKDWFVVRHKVGDLMMDKVTGRTKPIRTNRSGGNARQVLRLLREPSPFHGSYPRHVTKKSQKLRWLKKQKRNGEISDKLFTELKGAIDL